MPFLILGIIMLAVGFVFYRGAKRSDDKEGAVGMIALMIAGFILVILYGVLYRLFL